MDHGWIHSTEMATADERDVWLALLSAPAGPGILAPLVVGSDRTRRSRSSWNSWWAAR